MSETGESPPAVEPPEDRCHSCNGPLASDQRYCVHCGERRGRARFSLAKVAAELAPPPAPAPPPKRRRQRMSTGVTLVTGVATLLLAMGVGVLIGHDSSNTPATKNASAPVQVVTVGGGGGGGTAAAQHKTSAGKKQTVASTAQSTKPLVKLNFKPSKVKLTGKTVSNAAASAQKVLGQRGNLAPPTVQPGQKCAHGAGCQGGKFTGNFFH